MVLRSKMSTAITETHIDRQATLTRDKKTFNGIIRSCAETKLAEGVSAGAEIAVPKGVCDLGNGTVRLSGKVFAGIFLQRLVQKVPVHADGKLARKIQECTQLLPISQFCILGDLRKRF